jgi:hypothetical protein
MAFGQPPAYMGFVGFVQFNAGNILGNGVDADTNVVFNDIIVRATSADINLSQEVTKPDVIDSRYDKTVYQLGPKIIEGSIVFPAVYDIGTGTNIVDLMYRFAATRAATTGLLSDFDCNIKYAESVGDNVASFVYENNIVNAFKFAVSAENIVEITADVIGVSRTPASIASLSSDYMQNTRIVTWNDARVEIGGGRLGGIIGGQYIRSFEANINNNAERFYTLNWELFAQAIAPTKRDVDGNVVIMGRQIDLGSLAQDNEFYCSEDQYVKFGFETQGGTENCTASFGVQVPNCVFEIETMSLTNSLFETTVNWHALPSAGTGISDPLVAPANMNPTFSDPDVV